MKTIKPSKIIGAFCMLIAVSFMFITPTFAAEDTSGAPGASGTSSASNAVGDPCDSTVEAVRKANGCDGSKNALPGIVENIIEAIILVMGIVAVIAIVYGGVQYMTSTGNTDKIQKAKHTILYAVIGLIICVLAYAIVNFVIGTLLKQS